MQNACSDTRARSGGGARAGERVLKLCWIERLHFPVRLRYQYRFVHMEDADGIFNLQFSIFNQFPRSNVSIENSITENSMQNWKLNIENYSMVGITVSGIETSSSIAWKATPVDGANTVRLNCRGI